MDQIEAFTCGRGMIVAFHGGILKTRRQYIQYRNGTYQIVTDDKALSLFDRIKLTLSHNRHANSEFFGRVKLDQKDLDAAFK